MASELLASATEAPRPYGAGSGRPGGRHDACGGSLVGDVGPGDHGDHLPALSLGHDHRSAGHVVLRDAVPGRRPLRLPLVGPPRPPAHLPPPPPTPTPPSPTLLRHPLL